MVSGCQYKLHGYHNQGLHNLFFVSLTDVKSAQVREIQY